MAMGPETLRQPLAALPVVVGRLRPGVTVGAGAGRHGRHRRARSRRRIPATNDRRGVTLVPLTEQIVGDVQDAALRARRRRADGAAHRLRQRRQPDADSRRVPAARAGAARRARRRSHAHRPAVARRGSGARRCGRRRRPRRSRSGRRRVLARVAEPLRAADRRGGIDVRVLAFLVVVSVVSGLLFALAPVLTSGRQDIRDALQDNHARTAGPGPAARRVRGALAIGELAIACVLVIGAGLVLKSFWRLMQVSPGFATERVLSGADRAAAGALSRTAPQITALLRHAVRAPGRRAGRARRRRHQHLADGRSGPRRGLTIEGRPRPAGEPPEVNYRTASADYFRALDVPVDRRPRRSRTRTRRRR